jgi:hypothetical protein
LSYKQNRSDGKLETPFANEKGTSIWPLIGYEFSVLETEKFNINKFSPFLSEGLGWIVTNGYSNSGWSRDFAIVTGLGTDCKISKRFAARASVTCLTARRRLCARNCRKIARRRTTKM